MKRVAAEKHRDIDFSRAKRGPGVKPQPGKTKISIRPDNTVLKYFRDLVAKAGGGNAGLRRAVALVWPRAAVQRCGVHKLRNLERKVPKHALAEIRNDFHRIVYAANADAARVAYAAFERTWAKRCPSVVTSLREGGDETLRTTNTIQRLHE